MPISVQSQEYQLENYFHHTVVFIVFKVCSSLSAHVTLDNNQSLFTYNESIAGTASLLDN